MTCGTCAYWQPPPPPPPLRPRQLIRSKELAVRGACHYSPPPHPPTEPTDWCGCWKDKGPVATTEPTA